MRAYPNSLFHVSSLKKTCALGTSKFHFRVYSFLFWLKKRTQDHVTDEFTSIREIFYFIILIIKHFLKSAFFFKFQFQRKTLNKIA